MEIVSTEVQITQKYEWKGETLIKKTKKAPDERHK